MSKPAAITGVTEHNHIVFGVFAEPGIGKSRLAGTSPGKVLIIRPPVDHLNALLPADKSRVEQWVIHDWDDMWKAEEHLRSEGQIWDWVWVDSWSLLQDVLLDDLFETAIVEKPTRKRFGPDKPEYGINMYRIGSWMRHVIGPDLFNFGFTAHPATLASPDLDADGDPMEKLMPWVQGKNMSPKLCGYTNLLAFMEASGAKKRRVIRTRSDQRFYAKDQFDAFGEDGTVWDPTMPKIIKLINQAAGRNVAAGEPARKTAAKAVKRTVTRKGR
jgi:hypothetical protein